MTNKLKLVQQIAAIALCVFLTHAVHYSQSANTQSSQEVVRLRSKVETRNLRILEFSPVSKLLAIQLDDGSIRIIDTTDTREQTVLPLSDKRAHGMHWTSDGLRLLVISSKSAVLWDARRATRVFPPIENPRGGFDSVELSPDDRLLLNLKERNGLKASLLEKDNFRAQVWDLESGKMRFEARIDGLEGRAQFSPDSRLLLTNSATDDPKLWDVETGRLFATLNPGRPLVLCRGFGAQFSPDGKFVVDHRNQCGTRIWDTTTGALKTERFVDKDHRASVLMGFSADGEMFVLAQQTLKGWTLRTSIELRDRETGELRSTLTASKWEDWPQDLLWGNDGRTLVVTSGYKYKGRVWDAGTGTLTATIPLVLTYSRIPFDFGSKDSDVLSLHPSLLLISAASNKVVKLWNAETGELMQRLENTGGNSKWSADGKLLLTFTENFTSVFVWDVVGPESVTRARSVQASVID
jgi:WD40 repeat protein